MSSGGGQKTSKTAGEREGENEKSDSDQEIGGIGGGYGLDVCCQLDNEDQREDTEARKFVHIRDILIVWR